MRISVFGLIGILLALLLLIFGCNAITSAANSLHIGNPFATAPTTAPTTAPAAGPRPDVASGPAAGPTAAPASGPAKTSASAPNFDVKSKHLDGGEYVLKSGEAINGGIIMVNGTKFSCGDGCVTVLTNHSNTLQAFSCPAGCGWESTDDYSYSVAGELKRGCSASGCNSVLWVDIDANGKPQQKTLTK